MGDRNVYILHCCLHIGLLRAVLVHCGLYKALLLFASWFQRQLDAFKMTLYLSLMSANTN